MPFDWWIIHAKDVANLLREGFDDIVREDDLEFFGNREMVLNKRKMLWHHHDFKRDENHRIEEGVAEQIPGVVKKFEFLGRRFDDACRTADRILFVHEEEAAQPPREFITADDSAASARLIVEALQHRHPGLEADLIYLVSGEELPGDLHIGQSTVCFDRLGDAQDAWQASAYRSLFTRHPIQCKETQIRWVSLRDYYDGSDYS